MLDSRIARSAASLAVVLAAVLFSATAARATTVVVPTDEQLLAASRAVVEGTVREIRSRRAAGGRRIFTYVTVDVSRVLAGDVTRGTIVLKQMGGTVGDDFSTIHGSPEFEVGERVLLYLTADEDGALHTTFLFLGKFSLVERDGRTWAVRGEAPDGVLAVPAEGGATDAAPYDEYAAAVERRARATKRAEPAAPFVAVPAELATAAGDEQSLDKFTRLGSSRWFEPDEGLPVRFNIRYTPFLLDGGLGAVTDSLAAWSSVSGSSLRLELGVDTTACGSIRDGESTVSFDDCRNQIDGGGCFGIIAIGGATGRTSERKTVNGIEYFRITEADVVLNNGQDTCLIGHRLTLREVITHELGHAVGLGHSSQTVREEDPRLLEATMFYKLHDDGRGASIKPDDEDGIRFIYPAAITPPVVATGVLAGGHVGSSYASQLEATGGEAPYTWTISSGALPSGLALSPAGLVTGTPEAKGMATFTVTVSDSRGQSASRDLTMEVLGAKPVVASAVFKKKKLRVEAVVADTATIEIWVNGARVSPPSKVKVKPGAGDAWRLTIKGTAGALNVTQPPGTNSLVVISDGVASAGFSF